MEHFKVLHKKSTYTWQLTKHYEDSRKFEKLPNIVIHACKNITEKNAVVENLALFIYVLTHCIEQLNCLTTINTLSLLVGAVVTHQLWVQEVLGEIPGSGKGFYVWLFCFVVVVFLFFVQKHILCHIFFQFLLQCYFI